MKSQKEMNVNAAASTRAKETYTVKQNPFHSDDVIYTGHSIKQAVKYARKYDCSDCKCGGPNIIRGSDKALYHGWEAKKPFVNNDSEPWWFFKSIG